MMPDQYRSASRVSRPGCDDSATYTPHVETATSTAADPAADPLLGTLLDGRYRIERRVARGGMATVYAATDQRLDRTVALKILHAALAEDPEFVARFEREARTAARLSHPHVVSVHDQGESDGRVFLVMEYVEGQTLRDLLDELETFPEETASRCAETSV